MKKWITFFLSAMLMLMLCACGSKASESSQVEDNKTEQQTETDMQSSEEQAENKVPSKEGSESDGTDGTPEAAEDVKILVAYFSATGTTRPIAEQMAEILGADLYEIVPAQSYSEADLNYNDDSCRANQEQNDSTARPEISVTIENMEQYDIVLIGHPIWWGEEPRILDTFMESYDWSGKTLANFCTSCGSGISTATAHLKEVAPDADWLGGNRFQSGASKSQITEWLVY